MKGNGGGGGVRQRFQIWKKKQKLAGGCSQFFDNLTKNLIWIFFFCGGGGGGGYWGRGDKCIF